MRRIGPITFAPIALALLAIAVSAPSRADELHGDNSGVQIGKGIMCDTEQQAQRLADLMANKDPEEAMNTVNKEADNPLACGMAVVAFQTGKHIGDVHNEKGTFKIMEIKVIAAATPEGWRTVDGTTQFAPMPVAEIET